MKTVKVVLSPEAEEVYNYLNKEAVHSKIERGILMAVNKKSQLIKENPHYGNPISKKLIPKEYKEKYGISNLFRVELPNRWRMLYSLTDSETKVEIIAFVLDLVDHSRYDKKFGYRKR
jgi:hypothetical protein